MFNLNIFILYGLYFYVYLVYFNFINKFMGYNKELKH